MNFKQAFEEHKMKYPNGCPNKKCILCYSQIEVDVHEVP